MLGVKKAADVLPFRQRRYTKLLVNSIFIVVTNVVIVLATIVNVTVIIVVAAAADVVIVINVVVFDLRLCYCDHYCYCCSW